MEDPVVNTLTGASWATGTQCLGVDMEVVVLVPVIDGMRHSKPFYINEQAEDDGLLRYCVGSCVDADPRTSVRLEIVAV